MLTHRTARDGDDACTGKEPFGRARHWYGPSAGVSGSPVPRLKAVAYLLLLCAVIPAASYIAVGRAGVPVLFSTACGVVSCVAVPGNVPVW
jgi:hypothetical protein